MPTTTYSGTVVTAPLGTPAPSTKIVALRPRQDLNFYPPALLIPYSSRDETIGRTYSQSDGQFSLATTGGYATRLFAVSEDGWMEGLQDSGLGHHSRSGLALTLHAAQREISYHSVSLNKAECNLLTSAFGKITEQYLAAHRKHAVSIETYRARGVLSPKEYALLVRLKPHLMGEHPDIEMVFSRCIVRLDAFSRPVRFEPHRDPFGGAAALGDISR
jgi:hypothetical protein